MLQSPLSNMGWGRGRGLSHVDKINTALGGGVGRRRVKLFLEKGGVLRVGSIYANIF